MSDDALPPLPTSDDPFELLGVADEVDERELKRAYARMIKRYRPDRAPNEFARIQSAFEQARWLSTLRRPVPDSDPVHVDSDSVPDSGPVPDSDPDSVSDSVPVPGPVPIPVPGPGPVPAADPAPDLARALADALARRSPADVFALVDDDRLVAAAEDEVGLALLALRAITTMAWHDGAWPRALARYRALPRHPRLDDALAVTEVEVAGAAAIRACARRPPQALVELLRRRRTVSRTERAELVRHLARSLDRERASYLAAFDELVRTSPVAADALAAVITLDLPPRATESAHLPDQVYQAVHRRLQPIENLTGSLALAGVVAFIALCGWLGWLGFGIAVAAAAIAAGVWTKLDRLPYAPHVRQHAAGLLVAYAVPAGTMTDCLDANPEPRGFLHRYACELEADRGLALLGLTATLAWSRRLVWRPVIDRPPPTDDDGENEDDRFSG